MDLISVLVIAVGLAMDAVAVSLCIGATDVNLTSGQTIRVSTSFGLFQGVMPLLGWSMGRALYRSISAFDHWIAFLLLWLVGLKMIISGLRGPGSSSKMTLTSNTILLGLAVVTSLDALAIGISLAMMRVMIWVPCIIIATVTLVLSAMGVQVGKYLGARMSRWADLFGGLILWGIGTKILITHLT